MKKFEDFPYIKNAVSFIIAGIVLIAVYFLILNFQLVADQIDKLLSILTPFIYGLFIAFLLSPMVYWFEHRALVVFKWKTKTKHVISVVLTLVVTLEILVLFFSFIIPQLVTSISSISENLPQYIETFKRFGIPFIETYIPNVTWLTDILSSTESLLNSVLTLLQDYLPTILSYSMQFSRTVLNIFLAMTLAVYLLLDEIAFVRQFKRFSYALLGQHIGDEVVNVSTLLTYMVRKFILGKALNSFIMGILCYVAMLLLNLEYPVFMSALFGVTNMIPFFGPFIGGAIGAILLFLENPMHALWFILLVIALQNLEGSVLSPWLIGDSMGLPGLWVMFAILFGGGYFGIVGMFLGVPFFAVIYLLMKRFVDRRLESDQIKVNE